MQHVADIIIFDDPDGSPTIQAYRPGEAVAPLLKASIECLADIFDRSEIAEQIPALPEDWTDADLEAVIAAAPDDVEAAVERLNEQAISAMKEPRLPRIEMIEV